MIAAWTNEKMNTLDRVRIDVGDLHASNNPAQVLLTYALGSCLGVAIHDPQAKAGGLAHIQLPTCQNTTQHAEGVWSYADRALPELFQRVYALGATRQN